MVTATKICENLMFALIKKIGDKSVGKVIKDNNIIIQFFKKEKKNG